MKAVLRSRNGGMQALVTATVNRSSPLKFSWHYHQQFEMVLMLDGEGLRHVGDSLDEYASGDLVLMGPGLPHRYESSCTRVAKSKGCDFIVAHFSPSIFGTDVLSDPTFLRLSTLLNNASRGIAFDSSTSQEITPLLTCMPTLGAVGQWAAVLQVLDVLAGSLSSRTLCSAHFDRGAICADDEEPMNRTCKFIEDNLYRTVSLDEIASVVAMSPSSFTRFFRRTSGLSFVGYVNEIKTRRASMLLIETDTPIKTVAALAGFASTSYFHRKFVQRNGITPAEFRAKHLAQTRTSEITLPATSVRRKSRPIVR
jgi:AraC-like DNA-binding protein